MLHGRVIAAIFISTLHYFFSKRKANLGCFQKTKVVTTWASKNSNASFLTVVASAWLKNLARPGDRLVVVWYDVFLTTATTADTFSVQSSDISSTSQVGRVFLWLFKIWKVIEKRNPRCLWTKWLGKVGQQLSHDQYPVVQRVECVMCPKNEMLLVCSSAHRP